MVAVKGESNQTMIMGVGVAAITTYYVIAASAIYRMLGRFSSPNPRFKKLDLIDLPPVSEAAQATAASSSQAEPDANSKHLVCKLVSISCVLQCQTGVLA